MEGNGQMITFEKIDLKDYTPNFPEDVITFGDVTDETEPSRPDMSVPAAVIAMLREAKEKHLPVMFTNDDETRALVIKDANDLNLKITVNGVPFEEI